MPSDVQGAIVNAPKPQALYDKLEERILARDQKGASDVYYDLVRQRRPMREIVAEAVRIHAPYTHVENSLIPLPAPVNPDASEPRRPVQAGERRAVWLIVIPSIRRAHRNRVQHFRTASARD